MKNVFAFKIFCIELHKIQSKLTRKESLQQSNIDRFHELPFWRRNVKCPDLTKNQYHAIMHPMWRNCIECNDEIKNEIVTNFPFCIGVSSL